MKIQPHLAKLYTTTPKEHVEKTKELATKAHKALEGSIKTLDRSAKEVSDKCLKELSSYKEKIKSELIKLYDTTPRESVSNAKKLLSEKHNKLEKAFDQMDKAIREISIGCKKKIDAHKDTIQTYIKKQKSK